MSNYTISKTAYLKFEQCMKSFYLYKHHLNLRDKIDIDKNLTFKRGHLIGSLSKELFPGGTDVSEVTKNLEQAIQKTKELVIEKKTIYEATFVHNRVLVMVDILNFENGQWKAYEVKSSLKVTEVYLLDACLQFYVLHHSLPELADFYLVTLNGDYVKGYEEIDVKKLFKKRSVLNEAQKNLNYFENRIEKAKETFENSNVPEIKIGPHCYKPYTCDFYGYCWNKIIQKGNIFHFPLLTKESVFDLYENGFTQIETIPADRLTDTQRNIIQRSFTIKDTIVNKPKVIEFLSIIQFPLAALDMEIWSPVIPALENTRPFEQIPFLFCIYNNGMSKNFFTEHATDDQRTFAEELIGQTSEFKSLLVYDKSMEEQCIKRLINLYPDLESSLKEVNQKLIDISNLFKNLSVYDYKFQNSFTLKSVCNALTPHIEFNGIKSGLEAMSYYEQLRQNENAIEKEILKQDLISYCEKDVEAVIALFDYMKSCIK